MKKLALPLILLLSFFTSHANATLITVGGNLYEVEILAGSFADNRVRLETQPWWQNVTVLNEWLNVLHGPPSLIDNPWAYLAFQALFDINGDEYVEYYTTTFLGPGTSSGTSVDTQFPTNGSAGFLALVQSTPPLGVPLPGTLILLSLGIAVLLKVKRKKP